MKKILSLILCLMLSCSLVGCGESNTVDTTIKFRHLGNNIFMILDVGELDSIWVDVKEKTQYLYIDDGYDGGVTLLVDSEGKPLLYEGEILYELHKD